MLCDYMPIQDAIKVIQAGGMILLLDDENRENEGDLVIAAEKVTPLAINFMITYGRGLVCLPMAPELIDRLNLPMMVRENRSPFGTAFTVSIEALEGVSTGISAQDRAHTIKVAIDQATKPNDLVSPGHVFPLRAAEHGVMARAGQTEGSVDLVKLAGMTPAAVICEVLNKDGTMSRRDALFEFSTQHNIPVVTIRDLIEYRLQHELLIEVGASSIIPIKDLGDFEMSVFDCPFDRKEHLILVKRPKFANKVPLVRVHCECITGDLFGSCRCDCGEQLELSLKRIGEEGGVLVYLRQEGRGIGLLNKLKAYTIQEQEGLDTVDANIKLGFPADGRDYAIAYQILKYLGIDAIRLLTNNPDKIAALEKYGIKVTERVPLLANPGEKNLHYLKTKQEKLGHFLSMEAKNG
ncbi:MAG: bifunctional 3,4-dihydroxy-2-butanone 4-phosphate synthase/GTP cyclohydrolase II [Legionellales bacterium RIFCSPHIGHO2_12_FULL_37_14]|nr:MAG: bifunctional 3,4-dihydroxy-2-butanone 4-phosphate synthase/GTP cyclohydrolase II [Legionellales bacterium RIFCSPHIGHO2_12_FULL_37_14]